MATELRLRGGTTAQHASFTGATKEITVDTTKNTVVVHDGSTAGGVPLATESNLTSEINSSVHAPGTGLPNELDDLAAVKGGNTGALTIGTNDATNLTLETDNTARVTVNSAGNVGVGTSSPNARLHLQSSSGDNILFIDSVGSDTQAVNLANANYGIMRPVGQAATVVKGDSRLTFNTGTNGANEQMRITSEGNVGIGTSSPAEKLHVDGNFRLGSAVMPSPVGSAPLYACRAWVNFNGTGTVAIRDSGNVSSITDLGTGTYTVNFTTAMPDANYSCTSNGNNDFSNRFGGAKFFTTTSVRLVYQSPSALSDVEHVSAAIFR